MTQPAFETAKLTTGEPPHTAIERLTRQAINPTLFLATNEPSGRYYLHTPDGKTTLVTPHPPRHSETLESPDELRKFILQLGTDKKDVLFYGEERIVYVYDRDDMRDQVTVEMKLSDQFAWLKKRAGEMLSQSEIVRLLRITFRGCMSSDSSLLILLRQLNFNVDGNVSSTIRQGSESLGKQINAKVTGSAEIPEEFTLNVPVFSNHPFRTNIACALEVFPKESSFRITPYPLEVDKAMQNALDDVAMHLSPTNDGDRLPPIYRGEPTKV